MRSKLLLLGILMLAVIQQACVFKYSWKDYLPIVAVDLRPASNCVSASCQPQHKGKHILALRIEKVNRSPIPINLKVEGSLTIVRGDGTYKTIPFERHFIKDLWLPPSPFNEVILTFDIDDDVKLKDCHIIFEARIIGDVEDFLSREPRCQLVVCFHDGLK